MQDDQSSACTLVGKRDKGKAKKLRKTSEKGGVNTHASMIECQALGVAVEPFLSLSSPGGTDRSIRDLQSLVLSIVQAMATTEPCSGFGAVGGSVGDDDGNGTKLPAGLNKPGWVDVRNKAALQHMHVMCVTDAPAAMILGQQQQQQQQPFFSRICARATPLKLSERPQGQGCVEALDSFLALPNDSDKGKQFQKASGHARRADGKRKRHDEPTPSSTSPPVASSTEVAAECSSIGAPPLTVESVNSAGGNAGGEWTEAAVFASMQEYLLGPSKLRALGYPVPRVQPLPGGPLPGGALPGSGSGSDGGESAAGVTNSSSSSSTRGCWSAESWAVLDEVGLSNATTPTATASAATATMLPLAESSNPACLLAEVRSEGRLQLPSLEDAQRVLKRLSGHMAALGVPTGYVHTLPPRQEPSETCAVKTVVALDCEMVITHAPGAPHELARVTVVDVRGVVVLDELVKPWAPVADYLTKHSGVTQALLENVHTRIEQVQVALLRLVDTHTVVVGHSLENDFHALRLCHSSCLDTSVVYANSRGAQYKPALRYLTKEFLDRSIQQNSSDGHCSVEDSVAALDLAVLKVKRGKAFGGWPDDDAADAALTSLGSGRNCLFDSRTCPAVGRLRCAVVADTASLRKHTFAHRSTGSEGSAANLTAIAVAPSDGHRKTQSSPKTNPLSLASRGGVSATAEVGAGGGGGGGGAGGRGVGVGGDVAARVQAEASAGWHVLVSNLKWADLVSLGKRGDASTDRSVDQVSAAPGASAESVATALPSCAPLPTQLTDNEAAQTVTTSGPAASATAAHAGGADEAAAVETALKRLTAPSATPSLTAVLLQPPTTQALAMVRQRKAALNVRSSVVWTAEQEKELTAHVKAANRAAVLFYLTKKEGGGKGDLTLPGDSYSGCTESDLVPQAN